MKKIVLFAFSDDMGIFVHVMMNAVDMKAKGYDAKIVIETGATKFVKELMDETKPFAKLFKKVKDEGMIDGVCKACSAMTGSQEAAKEQGLRLLDEMNGHPSIARYIEEGFLVLSF